MGANKPDIDNLKLVLHRYDQPIRISLDVEYDAVVAKNATAGDETRPTGYFLMDYRLTNRLIRRRD
jgi:hypothetical protein